MTKTKFQQNELTRKWIQSYRHLNRTQGLSQLKLQKDIGMNQSFISQILNNRVNFPQKYLEKYCKLYHVNISSIAGGSRLNISVNGVEARSTGLLYKRAGLNNKGVYSVDKALESLKHALSHNGNGSPADIKSASRILNTVESKLSSLQSDIFNLQMALSGTASKAKRGRKARR